MWFRRRGECRSLRGGQPRTADRYGPSASSSPAWRALREGGARTGKSDAGRGPGPSAEDARRPQALSVRLIWSFGSGPSTGGAGGLPPGFLPVAAVLAWRSASLASCSARSLVALFRPRLDLRARLRELHDASRRGQLFGNRHAVGDVGLVLRLGARQQIRHLGLQLRLELAQVLL